MSRLQRLDDRVIGEPRRTWLAWSLSGGAVLLGIRIAVAHGQPSVVRFFGVAMAVIGVAWLLVLVAALRGRRE